MDEEEDVFRKTDDNEFIEILLNLTLYDYEPLVSTAFKLLFRHMRFGPFLFFFFVLKNTYFPLLSRPRDELVSTLRKVQLLTNEEAVKVFTQVSVDNLSLQELLKG